MPGLNPEKVSTENAGSWNQVYKMLATAELPWNAGGPDPDLIRAVEERNIPITRSLDVGTGPGHDAVYLAKKGSRVIAVDIAPAAIELARKTASAAGIPTTIDFRAGDVLKQEIPEGSLELVYDRGCFHVLSPEFRKAYVEAVHRWLAPGGHLALKTFSDAEPPGPGPYRFSKQALEQLFLAKFDLIELTPGVFLGPQKPKAYFSLFHKRA